jgi:hypothetical protein
VPELRTVVLDGVLTQDSAQVVVDAVGSLQAGGTLLVDLTRAREVPPVMLAQLVRLSEAHRQSLSIRFVGLRWREFRLLGYLGLELDPAGRPVAPPPPVRLGT